MLEKIPWLMNRKISFTTRRLFSQINEQTIDYRDTNCKH